MVYTIPSIVTTIEEAAFLNCTSLTDITISGSVTSLGEGAFYNCSGLSSITIPDRVTFIGNNAFTRCTSLISVTFEGNSTEIGFGVFPYGEVYSETLKNAYLSTVNGGAGTYTRTPGQGDWAKL